MEELSVQEIIEKCMTLGVCTIIDQDIIPGANRTRITKAHYTWEGFTVENRISYVNPVSSNSIYAIQSDEKEVIYG